MDHGSPNQTWSVWLQPSQTPLTPYNQGAMTTADPWSSPPLQFYPPTGAVHSTPVQSRGIVHCQRSEQYPPNATPFVNSYCSACCQGSSPRFYSNSFANQSYKSSPHDANLQSHPPPTYYNPPPPQKKQIKSKAVPAVDKPALSALARHLTSGVKERRRTQALNTGFCALRRCLPDVPADTKLSKIRTLRLAIDYIRELGDVLEKDDERRSQKALKMATQEVFFPHPQPLQCHNPTISIFTSSLFTDSGFESDMKSEEALPELGHHDQSIK